LAGEIDKAVEGYRQAEAWPEMFASMIQHPELFDLIENAKNMASAYASQSILSFN